MLLLLPAASAATIAVLDLWGPGVSRADAVAASEQLRAAFTEKGRLDPLSAPDIADGVSAGHEAELRDARDRLAEARRLYDDGEPRQARAALVDAIAAFRAAHTDLGGREELAEAYFLDGLCAADVGDAVTARKAFERALRLVPDLDQDRAAALPSDVTAPLKAAHDTVRMAPVDLPSGEELAPLGATLSVDLIAVGVLRPDGTVELHVHGVDGGSLGQLDAHLRDVPSSASDPAWGSLAEAVAGRVDAMGAPPPPRTAGRVVAVDPEESDEETAATRPVATRWWFWVLMTGLVGGGAAAVAIAAMPDEAEVSSTPASYTVTVELPD